MRVTFVTSNPHKFREVEGILRPFGVVLRWRRRELLEPQATSLPEVVRAKIGSVPRSWDPVIVEDSGLFVRDLRGFPGVYSRYVYETIGLPGVLRLLRGRPRGAEFRTAAALRMAGRTIVVEGIVAGAISARRRGRGGFGFDPIFVPAGSRRTYAEMGTHEKGRTSHRARAIRGLAVRIPTRSLPERRWGPGSRRNTPDRPDR